jgi:diguanylate cyclase (GGDEF)-like protein/PAS domain S-box-containing protein
VRTSRPQRTPDHDGELFIRQVSAHMRLAPWANLANAMSVLVLWLYVISPQHPRFGAVWVTLALLASGTRSYWWPIRDSRRTDPRDPAEARRMFRVTALEITIQGVLNTGMTYYVLPRVDPGRQVVLVATVAGVMGSGAVVLSTLRSIGILWVSIQAVGFLPAFLAMRQTAYWVLSLQTLVYGGVLILGVIYLSNSFERRSLAEFAARRAQQDVELLLDDFEDGARDWLWETTPQGELTRTSDRMSEVSGHTTDQLRQLRLAQLLGRLANESRGGAQAVQELSDAMARGGAIREHHVPVVVQGTERWWSLSAKPMRSRDGLVTGWRGVGVDTTDEVTHRQEMVRLAETDPLTDLANRRSFSERLQSCLAGRERPGPCHLAIFDLDNFKAVNDTLGHGVGDELLQQVATRMLGHGNGNGDFVARLGGDEFAVITQPESAPDFPEVLFARYLTAFTEPFTVRGNRIEMTASVGCTHAVPHSISADEMVRMADLALYDAKAVGHGRMSSFTQSMSMRARERSSLLADLARAIDNEEFLYHYQPQHDVRTGRVVATEALLRWQHPTRGLLVPADFLDVALESGLIVPIGEIMLRRACRELSGLGRGVRLAVNVSEAELGAAGFLDHVEGALIEFGVPANLLELEVTESAAISDHSISLMHELRHLGVRIAIDDFGTGYSSLNNLQRMPVDLLKVDRAFAAALATSDKRASQTAVAVMKAAVDIASALGISTLAEGIERADQLSQVRALGFDLVQGFFLATPTPAVTRHLTVVEPPSTR